MTEPCPTGAVPGDDLTARALNLLSAEVEHLFARYEALAAANRRRGEERAAELQAAADQPHIRQSTKTLPARSRTPTRLQEPTPDTPPRRRQNRQTRDITRRTTPPQAQTRRLKNRLSACL
ncbi:hypothetical protein [Couchioplanes caeruleus]|uniref:Uncharacterized protein n=2 Tax=Couchioplanes caeruleus TaxID=56438 RepID=A0A1K0G678_9ACTN|nr:hypothetical protein [Couchioplanes caeruleus]OJF12778.1 hypothetical protein BG844_18800 [Couchioplanes caeruleus subsp. caeruleus]ROP29423.1 hypothetical protein EDD30_2217 [Couchioplanes caeruleus]